jgi:hypothetical protein
MIVLHVICIMYLAAIIVVPILYPCDACVERHDWT